MLIKQLNSFSMNPMSLIVKLSTIVIRVVGGIAPGFCRLSRDWLTIDESERVLSLGGQGHDGSY